MSNANVNPAIRAVLVDELAPAVHAAGDHETAGIDMSLFETALYCATVGAFGAGATAEIQLEQATTAAFTDAKVLRDPVDLVASTPVQISLRSDELDVNGGFRFVRAVLSNATQTVTAGIVGLGLNARYQPAAPLTGAIVAG